VPDLAVVFLITLRHGIWRITKDGVFFGDYRSKNIAEESAETAAIALRRIGRAVKIVTLPKEQAQ
jgi:hypothetical protein